MVPKIGIHVRVDLTNVSEDKRVRLMLRKLGAAEYEKLTNLSLPKKRAELPFNDVVAIWSPIFGEQTSFFCIRYRCLTMTKRDDEDRVSYLSRINREYERSKFHKMSDDQYKFLNYVCGPQGTIDADVRTRILSRIEQSLR